jgi:hypothetical protein
MRSTHPTQFGHFASVPMPVAALMYVRALAQCVAHQEFR